MLGTRTLLLARHGETSWNLEARWQGHTDIPLNHTGRAQAAALAERLRRFRIGHVYTSDLARARETGVIIAQALEVASVIVDARLRERGFGAFEGLTRDQCIERYPEAWAAYQDDRKMMPPGSEPHEAVIDRVTAGVHDAMAAITDDAPVLIVAHGGALRLFLGATFGRSFPPIANGAVMRATILEDKLHDVEELVDLAQVVPPFT